MHGTFQYNLLHCILKLIYLKSQGSVDLHFFPCLGISGGLGWCMFLAELQQSCSWKRRRKKKSSRVSWRRNLDMQLRDDKVKDRRELLEFYSRTETLCLHMGRPLNAKSLGALYSIYEKLQCHRKRWQSWQQGEIGNRIVISNWCFLFKDGPHLHLF